jgi:hypothetical protein
MEPSIMPSTRVGISLWLTALAAGLALVPSSATAGLVTYTNGITDPLAGVNTPVAFWGANERSEVRSHYEGGNPGPYLIVDQSTGGNWSRNFQFVLFTDFVYTPSLQSAIDTIDFQLDYRRYYATFGDGSWVYMVIEQGGNLYTHFAIAGNDPSWNNSWETGTWKTYTSGGLNAGYFSKFSPGPGAFDNHWVAEAPDFSATGGAMRFGFMSDIGAVYGGQGFVTLYDNYTLRIQNQAQAVPEPSTLALLAVGGIGLLPFARRKIRNTFNR